MTFRDPRWLWLLAAVPFAALFLVARERWRERLARRFIAEPLRGVSNPARWLRPWLIALGLAAAIVALAGPEVGFALQTIEAREANRVILLDVSNSMEAQDVGASRLDAAKAVAKRIIAAHPGRVGLIIFEADAEVVSPLTNDSDAVAELVDSIAAGEVGDPGSDIGKGLLAALKLIDADPTQKADIVLISDGEEQGRRVADAVAKLKPRGIAVSTILVGTEGGATIPDGEGKWLVDNDGQVVRTSAQPDVLQSIARDTGGTFFVNPFAEHALDSLASSVAGSVREKRVRVPINRFQWPLAFAFMALLLGSVANRGAE
jgi:Ca-activated chloride channel family protein